MRLIDRSILVWGCLIVLVTMSASCSRNGGPSKNAEASKPTAAQGAGAPAASPAKAAPSLLTTLTDVNLAAVDNGGAVEDISTNYGPGYDGRLLIDGRTDPTWKVPTTWTWGAEQWVKYPW